MRRFQTLDKGNFIKRGYRILTCLLLLAFIVIDCFSMGIKQLIPMKTYPVTDIQDGEFLHYGYYAGGEKVSDNYYVTKKIKNEKSEVLYRMYNIIIPVLKGKKPPENYTNWPVSILIDPGLCSTIESAGHYDVKVTKDSEVASVFGIGGLVYWHYQFYRDKGSTQVIPLKTCGVCLNLFVS